MKNSKQSNMAVTTVFRRKIWAREVRWALFPTKPKTACLANKTAEEITENMPTLKLNSDQVNKLNELAEEDEGLKRKVLSSNICASNFHGWWKGYQHIDSRKLAFIDVFFPGTKDWFHYNLPLLKNESLKTYLYAWDVYAQEQDSRDSSIKGLNWICKKWGPICKHDGDATFINKPQWYLPLLEKNVAIDLYEKYNILEPSSIIGFMLHLAVLDDFLDNELTLKQWAFDLTSASLMTQKLINQHNNPMNINTGQSGMNCGAVIKIFISKIQTHIQFMHDAKKLDPNIENTFYVSRIVESLNEANELNLAPCQQKRLTEKLHDGFQLYMQQLLDYDINEQDLVDLFEKGKKPLLIDLEKI